MGSLQNQSGHAGSGIVKITPVFPLYLSDSIDGLPGLGGVEDDEANSNEELSSETRPGPQLPAFSGAFTSAQVRDVFETEMDQDNSSDRDGASTIFEETESISVGEMMKSPVFSEDESTDISLWIDLGQSPLGSDNNGRLIKQKAASPLPPSWFIGKKNKQLSPKPLPKMPNRSIYDEELNQEELDVLSIDSAVLSMSHEQLTETQPSSQNGGNGWYDQEIEEEPQTSLNNPNQSAIKRETEGEFRLLGRREGGKFANGRFVGVEELEEPGHRGRSESFSMEDHHNQRVSHSLEDEEYTSDGEYDDRQDSDRREPELVCRHLDHVNMLGLNKTTLRLRFLTNWLVTSLLQLKFLVSDGTKLVPLVHIYGPKIKYERGAAVAFNVRDRNRGLINPELVQKLAETNGIALGIGILSHIRILDSPKHQRDFFNLEDTTLCRPMENSGGDGKYGFVRVEVVTASLGFLTDFNDVYKLWAFVAKFLNPAFIQEGGLGEGSQT